MLGLCFLIVHAQQVGGRGEGEVGAFNFVVLSDLHIGESSEALVLTQQAINTVCPSLYPLYILSTIYTSTPIFYLLSNSPL